MERYCLRFTDGELSNADGVGIVFSSQLPCPQNIQCLGPLTGKASFACAFWLDQESTLTQLWRLRGG